MTENYHRWYHPYKPAAEFKKKIAYFSMEFGIHQALKIYSGGLGFLAGSHMRSAYELKQNMIGIGMLWKYGYYDQGRNQDQSMQPRYVEKQYAFLEDSGHEVEIQINDNPSVKVRAMVLKPEIFGSVPIYLLTTDVDGNDYLSRTITNHLYDDNLHTRISQSMVLGIGGAKLVEALGGADIYHLNEGHALPAFFHLRNKGVSRRQMVFTTHTPEKAGNEEHDGKLLNNAGFFGRKLSDEELQLETIEGGLVNYTVSALRMAKKANAVSKLHCKVARGMWEGYRDICKIIPITNSQNQHFWQDPELARAWRTQNQKALSRRKKELKARLFEVVMDQTGKRFDPNVLTIVWARRFAQYKRADLLLHDLERFEKLVQSSKYPVQIIWAGKPYPLDNGAIEQFNRLVQYTKYRTNLAVLVGYEMKLSALLKSGSDIWLNTPRITREASGTSGMAAAMNASLNLSVNDGWIPEFARNGVNAFVLPEADPARPVWEQDEADSRSLYQILENEVLPTYYDAPDSWHQLVTRSMEDVLPEFSSQRMSRQYYKELYQ
jgi:starch phosphorylase